MKSVVSVVLISIFAVACNTTGVPTEFANACSQDLDGKTIEVSGILQPRSSVYCSNRGGRMECPFELVQTAGDKNYITADIEVGTGANSVTEIPKGFKKEDLKVRDNAGNQVNLGSDKLKLTGKMMIAPGAAGNPGVCLMQVYKIER